jgi:glycosyltransferase involved in cell wall biosynthesis
VSIVVPTHDRPGAVADCVESLLAQDYPVDRFEVVVVENGSTGGTAQLAGRSDARLHILTIPRADANAARNAGVRHARGDPVCLVDDDVVAPPTWLAALVAGFLRHGVESVGGPVRPRYDVPPLATCERHAMSGTSLHEGPLDKEFAEVWGCNMAVSREALGRVGPFREGLRVLQEWEWQRRLLAAGGRTYYVADAWLYHRRLAEDMRPFRLMRDAFTRGWVLGRYRGTVQPRDVTLAEVRRQTRRSGHSLLHGVRDRCVRGFTDFARASSQVAGSIEGLLRRRLGYDRSPSGT